MDDDVCIVRVPYTCMILVSQFSVAPLSWMYMLHSCIIHGAGHKYRAHSMLIFLPPKFRERECMGKKKKNGGGGGGAGVGGEEMAPVSGSPKQVEEKDKNDGGETKTKEGGGGSTTTVVLKVHMHCEGCAEKVKRSVRGVEGVEKVTADLGSNKLTVMGKVDPTRIRERVQKKTNKHAELISPAPPKKSSDDPNKKGAIEKKPKEPQAATVGLKIWLHCEGCTQRIRKTIMGIKGVASVSVEPQKDLVTVRGVMDVKALPEMLRAKLKRSVEVVQPKKEQKAEDGGGEKKKAEEEMARAALEAMREEYAYYVRNIHAPQLFSDENPNSCSIL